VLLIPSVLAIQALENPVPAYMFCAKEGEHLAPMQQCCSGLHGVSGVCVRGSVAVRCARNERADAYGGRCCPGFVLGLDGVCRPPVRASFCASHGQMAASYGGRCCERLTRDAEGMCMPCAGQDEDALRFGNRCCRGLANVKGFCKQVIPGCAGQGRQPTAHGCCKGLVAVRGVCGHQPECAIRGQPAAMFNGKCCPGLVRAHDGVCSLPVPCAAEGESISSTRACCRGLMVVRGTCQKP
jgi:hypothetical protein